jgi:hypothetical protein
MEVIMQKEKKKHMNVLGLKDSDIFQIQMVWYDPNKDDKKK